MIDDSRLIREALDHVRESYKHYDVIANGNLDADIYRSSEEGMCALVLVRYAPEGEVIQSLIVDFELGVQDAVPSHLSLDDGLNDFVLHRMRSVDHRLRLKRWRSSTLP